MAEPQVTRLLLVRHGASVGSHTGRYHGQADLPLSSLGVRQAEALALRLAGEALDGVFSSDLGRARHTAQIIALSHGRGVYSTPALREASFGSLEGLSFEEMSRHHPAFYHPWEEGAWEQRPPDGESMADVAHRARPFLDEILEERCGQGLLLVSHGGTLRVLLCHLLGLGLDYAWRWQFDLASLSRVTLYDEAPVVFLLNDTSHLEGLE